jgi:hypothetical protein
MFSTYPSFVENFFKTLKQLRFQGWTFLRFQVKRETPVVSPVDSYSQFVPDPTGQVSFTSRRRAILRNVVISGSLKLSTDEVQTKVVISHNTIANDTQFISPDDGGCTHL